MAAIHPSLIDNSEITHPTLKAFLHQRTRQWKYTDLSFAPTQCIDLPDDYATDTPPRNTPQDKRHIYWTEDIAMPEPFSGITKTLSRLKVNVTASTRDSTAVSTETDTDTSSIWKNASVLCPTFAGGKETAGECVFTDPAVQHAILSFFEEVAQEPEHYRNPAFTTSLDVPRPTADDPFALSADPTAAEDPGIQPAPPMMTPEQEELEEARAKLADMRIALDACPEDVDELAKGRSNLIQKIAKQEAEIKDLQVKALGSGSLGAGEAEEVRQDWIRKVDGQQVPFAGTMVDSELLKAAGLGGTASEELDKLGDGGGDTALV